MTARLVIRGGTVLTAAGARRAEVLVDGETVLAVGAGIEAGATDEVVDAGGLWVLPGLVDAHVHFDEPGRTGWEGWATGSAAAAAGGVTTVVDMPIDSYPPTTDAAALADKAAAALRSSHVDFAFWGGLTPANLGDLDALLDAGAAGLKAFACPSGWDDFEPVSEADLAFGLERAARRGVPVAVHCEHPDHLLDDPDLPVTVRRPPAAEVEAVRMVCRLAAPLAARVHVVHVSSAAAARLARTYPGATVETCPHYLALDDIDVDHIGPAALCHPPVRDAANRAALWEAVLDGTITSIASDHSPCPPGMKAGPLPWAGVASVGLALPVLLGRSEVVGAEHLVVLRLVAAAGLVGLDGKGAVASGYDADLVLLDPAVTWTPGPGDLRQRHPATNPYLGRPVRGRVMKTFLRGREIFDHEQGLTADPGGRWARSRPGRQAGV